MDSRRKLVRSTAVAPGVERFALRNRATAVLAAVLAAACADTERAPVVEYRRIVSLAPSTTELLFAIGAGDRVVGRTRWDADPPEVLDVPEVGDGLDPNVEAVAAREPDLVVLYESPTNALAVSQLHQLGIATQAFSMDRLDDVARGARLFGGLTATADRANAMADVFARALDSARAAAGPETRTRALLLSWDQPPIVIGGGSFQSELVALAGAENLFADIARPSAQVSIETIAARDPDVIVLTGDETEVPEWARLPEWRVVRAVREQRFAFISGTAFSYPSFRAFDAVDSLRAALTRALQ